MGNSVAQSLLEWPFSGVSSLDAFCSVWISPALPSSTLSVTRSSLWAALNLGLELSPQALVAAFLISFREMVSYHYISHKVSQGALIGICWMTARRQGGKKEKKKEFLPLTLYSAFNYILLISKNKHTHTHKNWQMKNSNEHHKPRVWILKDSQRKTKRRDKHWPRKCYHQMPLQYSSITNFLKILQMKKKM